MEPTLQAFLDILTALHDAAKRAVSGLSPRQLDWSPGEGMNSLAVLAAHTGGAERFWLGDVVMGERTGRDRDQEFATTQSDEATLVSALDTGLDQAARAFAALTTAQLAEPRTSPRDGREFSVAWSIGHVLQHTALHLGHMEITRQLLDEIEG